MLAVFAVVAFAGHVAAQESRVFTVDNTGGPHADFTDLQEAMDAAEDGDIFHVLGSPISYGDVTVTRQVHLFGPGYNLARVHTEGYQSFYEAHLSKVTIRPTPTTTPAGSTISGFKTGDVSIEASDVTLDRNSSTRITIGVFQSNGVVLEQPHRARITRNFTDGIGMNTFRNNSLNHLISNNIIGVAGGAVADIRHAIFRHNYSMQTSPTFENSVIQNNILRGVHSDSINNMFESNFFAVSQPSGNDFLSQNTFSENTWDLSSGAVNQFNALTVNTGAFDEAFKLAENSIAKGAGIDGVDLGPFDGPFPYQISGVPSLPRVKIMAPGPFTVSPDSDLTIPVKIKLD